MSDEIDDLR